MPPVSYSTAKFYFAFLCNKLKAGYIETAVAPKHGLGWANCLNLQDIPRLFTWPISRRSHTAESQKELLEIRLCKQYVTQKPLLSSTLYDYPQALISSLSPPITQDRNSFLRICISSSARELLFCIKQEFLKYILRIPPSL